MRTKLILIALLIHCSALLYAQVYLGIGYKAGVVNVQDKNSSYSKNITLLLITDVAENSPAQKAGILVGDLLCSVNKKDIESVDDFKKKIAEFNPNDKVTFLIQRENTSFFKEVVLQSTPSKTNEKEYPKCGLEFKEEAIKIVGNLLYLNLKFTNRSKKSIDNIEFTANFYNIYNEFIVSKDYTWETGILVSPIKPNTNYSYVEPAYINDTKTVKKYTIKLKRIHYTDDTICVF
jgi:membrane-associated protease RseP (regulator of RpoE activity)